MNEKVTAGSIDLIITNQIYLQNLTVNIAKTIIKQ